MAIMIVGATGLIGQALVSALAATEELILVGRSHAKLSKRFGDQHQLVTWDEFSKAPAPLLKSAEVLINLVGENIAAKRWTQQQKQEIIDSRVTVTHLLATHCAALGEQAPRWLNASAIGYYGLQASSAQQNAVTYDESSAAGDPSSDFVSAVCLAWEGALAPAIAAGVSVTIMRFSVVLTPQGGALARMLPVFRLGLGTLIGSGQQPFPWVTLSDTVQAILFLLHHPEISGPVNIVAEEQVSQQQFAHALAKQLHRPCLMRLPSVLVRLLFGQMGQELLLSGQKVLSPKLRQAGFVFEYDRLEAALSHLLTKA